MPRVKPTANELEAANRAEATALLIRAGFRVYRPEADCDGEDLVVRTPKGELLAVQLKSRPMVSWTRYGRTPNLWMLFPNPKPSSDRAWFLVPHRVLYRWVEERHKHTTGWKREWSYPTLSKTLASFIEKYRISGQWR